MSKTLDRLRRREQNPLGPEPAEPVAPAVAANRAEQAFSPARPMETPELSTGMLQILRHEVEQEKALLARVRADAEAREEELLRNIAELKSHSTALSLKLAEVTEQAELSEATRTSLENRARETENRLNRHVAELEKEAQVSAMRITQLSHALDEMQTSPANRDVPATGPQKQATDNLITGMRAIPVDDADGIAAKLRQAEDQRKHLEDDLAAREKKLGRKIADMEAAIRDLTKELSEAREQARQARKTPSPTAGRTMWKAAQAAILLGAVAAGAIVGRFSKTIPSPVQPPAAPPALTSAPAPAQTDVGAPLIPRETAVASLPATVAADRALSPNTVTERVNPPNAAEQVPPNPNTPQPLRPEPMPWPAINVEGVTTVMEGDSCNILFNDGVFSYLAIFRPETKDILQRIAAALRGSLPAFSLTVEGHTDTLPVSNNSPYANNYELGLARANTVVDFLERQCRLPKTSMTAVSAGEANPPFPNETSDFQRKNRTVIMRLVRAGQNRPQTP